MTEINFLSQSRADLLDTEIYKVDEFRDGIFLDFSKVQADNLPILATQLAENTPCYVPFEFRRKRIEW